MERDEEARGIDMATLYDKRHYENVADLFKVAGVLGEMSQWYVQRFADLFAADNPPRCSTCGASVCSQRGHVFASGFNREQFLAACGLESEG